MEWNNLKDQYRQVINEQIEKKLDEDTVRVYEKLLEEGYDHEKIVDKLIPYLHDSIIDQEEVAWKERIEPLMEDSIKDAVYIQKNKVDKMIKASKKEFGTIPNGTEQYYQEGIHSFETNIYTLCQLFGLNSRQLKEVAKVWLLELVSSYHEERYDLTEAFDNDFIEMAKPLIFNCNMYTNDDLMEQFKDQFPDMDVNDPETRTSTYTMNIRCLNKILDMMDLFNKKYGIMRDIGIIYCIA